MGVWADVGCGRHGCSGPRGRDVLFLLVLFYQTYYNTSFARATPVLILSLLNPKAPTHQPPNLPTSQLPNIPTSSHSTPTLTPQGTYRYNTKSKASWYWSRSWGATNRLGCQYYVLTDWQRWAFGVFDEKREHGWVSPVYSYSAEEPSIMQMLFYWAR